MKPPISGWLITGARGHAMQCGPERPSMTVIHGNDPVQSIEPLYSQDVIDAEGAEIASLREACEKAVKWLEGWASAEPYISTLRTALTKQEQVKC